MSFAITVKAERSTTTEAPRVTLVLEDSDGAIDAPMSVDEARQLVVALNEMIGVIITSAEVKP